MKKGMCELCSKKARLHCESDQARLCWECDEKVHGANFLVAKHCRSVLCHVCQATTPWKASGPKLFPTISLCGNCSANKNSRIEEEEEEEEEINQPQIRDQENGAFEETENEDDDENQEYSSSDDDEDEECDDVEEDDGENQVVPWAPSPPLVSSSSSSEEEVAADGAAAAVSSTLKRIYRTDYLDSKDGERNLSQNCGMSSLSSSRPWKLARNNGDAM